MNGTMLVGYNGSAANVTIPDGVTAIGEYAFQGRTSLTSVTLPNTLTSIGSSAFYGNKLTSIVIPDSVTKIGSGAFRQDLSNGAPLASITIGRNVDIDIVSFHINFGVAYLNSGKRTGRYVVIRNGGTGRNGQPVDAWERRSQ